MRTLTDREAHREYDDFLNELQPLERFACNPFSVLLAEGDKCAYDCGFSDYLDSQDIEIIFVPLTPFMATLKKRGDL